jgi:hypothetical protein
MHPRQEVGSCMNLAVSGRILSQSGAVVTEPKEPTGGDMRKESHDS